MEVFCKICDRGCLVPKSKHRLSGPAVFIGYILLVPSVLGIILGVGVLALSFASGQNGANSLSVFTGVVGAGFILSCIIGGLFGWLLVMKKQVLQCNKCSSVVNAS
jgi:hypothetical protein